MTAPLDPKDIEALLPYANPAQAKNLRALLEHGSQHAAAAALGRNQSTFSQTLARVRANAALRGYAPAHDMTRTVPEGFHVKGVSSYYPATEDTPAQWVRSQIDHDSLQATISEAIAALKETVPKAKLQPIAKAVRSSDLLNLHVITDFHLGMKSWNEETGEDWDLAIAEDLLIAML